MAPKEKPEDSSEGPLGGLVRELAVSGLSTLFMTEESVRTYLKDKKLPKDLAALLTDGIGKKKDVLVARVAAEFNKVFTKVDWESAAARFLKDHSVEVKASISFEPKNKKAKKEKSEGERPNG